MLQINKKSQSAAAAVREIEFDDVDGVDRLMRSVGWGGASLKDWRRIWIDNPALADTVGLPRGWVLQVGDELAGFLANLAQTYHFRGRKLRAAVAASLVVAPMYRGMSLQLVAKFARQTNVDLLMNTTSAPHVSKIMEFLKFARMPQPNYDLSLYWVLRPARFLNAGLRKKGWSALPAKFAGVLGSPLLAAAMSLLRRTPRGTSSGIACRLVESENVNDEFDELWRRKQSESRKILALRDAATLHWHFAAAGRKKPPRLMGAYRDGRLSGYIAVVRRDAGHLSLRRAYIADLFVERDDPETISALLAAATRQAYADGADMLEATGFPLAYQKQFKRFRPFTLQNEGWPFLYKAIDPELHRELTAADSWHACLYDGDGSL